VSFDVPKILTGLPEMTMAELRRCLKQAEDLNLRSPVDAIQNEIIRRRLPIVSSDDGASQALRDDCAASLEKSERVERKRHSYFRKSLAARGCKRAIANVVMHGGAGAKRTLGDLRALGILECAAESIVLRHAVEFDAAVIAKARETLRDLQR